MRCTHKWCAHCACPARGAVPDGHAWSGKHTRPNIHNMDRGRHASLPLHVQALSCGAIELSRPGKNGHVVPTHAVRDRPLRGFSHLFSRFACADHRFSPVRASSCRVSPPFPLGTFRPRCRAGHRHGQCQPPPRSSASVEDIVSMIAWEPALLSCQTLLPSLALMPADVCRHHSCAATYGHVYAPAQLRDPTHLRLFLMLGPLLHAATTVPGWRRTSSAARAKSGCMLTQVARQTLGIALISSAPKAWRSTRTIIQRTGAKTSTSWGWIPT